MNFRPFGVCFSVILLLALPLQAAKNPKHPSHKVNATERCRLLIKHIDHDTRSFQRTRYIEALCSQFGVPLSVVEELYGKGASTGKVTVLLAMSETLSQKDPTHFNTTADALFEVQRQRALSKSWASVARSLALPMDTVLRSARRSYNDVRGKRVIENAQLGWPSLENN